MIALESTTSDLNPGLSFWLWIALSFAAVAVLFIWPLVEAIMGRRPLWAVAIVLLFPFGGIAWFVVQRDRRSHNASSTFSAP